MQCRVFVLLAISRCLLLADGRLVIDSEHRGLVSDDDLLAALISPARGYFPHSKRGQQQLRMASAGATGRNNYEEISNSSDEDGREEEAEDYVGNNQVQVERRRSPTHTNHNDDGGGGVEFALDGNVDGSYDYPEDPYYSEDPVVTFDGDGFAERSVGKLPRPFPTFQPLCPYVRNIVHLDHSLYRQSSYEEINCLHPYGPESGDAKHNKVCGGAGFACIQKNRTIILVKRKHSQNCWETEARTINSGCDCMWPKHSLGDIKDYHG